MRRKRTKLIDAAKVQALADMGHDQREIRKVTGLPQSTVSEIIAGKHGWDKLKQIDSMTAYTLEARRHMKIGATELAKKALIQIENKLAGASAAQSGVLFGILVDKLNVMSGLPTEIKAIITRDSIGQIDALAERLSRSLKQDAAKTIDVTPETER